MTTGWLCCFVAVGVVVFVVVVVIVVVLLSSSASSFCCHRHRHRRFVVIVVAVYCRCRFCAIITDSCDFCCSCGAWLLWLLLILCSYAWLLLCRRLIDFRIHDPHINDRWIHPLHSFYCPFFCFMKIFNSVDCSFVCFLLSLSLLLLLMLRMSWLSFPVFRRIGEILEASIENKQKNNSKK